MSERFSMAMFTDHDYHGNPVEVSRVEVTLGDLVKWTPEMKAYIKHQAVEQLHSMAKRMPHKYWRERKP